MVPVITVEGLSRVFHVGGNQIYALKEISLSIEPNTLTLLQGPSGSGKTTLLNLLGTLDTPSEGHIYFKDRDITHLPEKSRDLLRRSEMGFVFQSVALISKMSAFENVDFALRICGQQSPEREERAQECLKMVNLGPRQNHMPAELSGGEQQRVAIARAIGHHPSIIFADEPTAELDTHMGLQIVKIFKKLIETEGITIVMTSHDPNMEELADRVIRLEDGRILSEDGVQA